MEENSLRRSFNFFAVVLSISFKKEIQKKSFLYSTFIMDWNIASEALLIQHVHKF